MAKFITFEGCEGVGKSTQLKLLEEYLKETGQEAVFTREPGGTPLAEKLREIILHEEMSAECEADLFAAARCEHIDNFILPSLGSGKTVICDRFIDSSIAYQGYARGLGRKRVEEINAYALSVCMPDAVVFIDMNPLESWRRQKGKIIENDRLEAENDGFHLAVYKGFKELSRTEKRFISVVPDEDKTATARKIREALRERGLIR